MPKNPPDQRLVYLALRHEFMPPDKKIKAKHLKEILARPEASSEVKALIQEYGADSICHVARTLQKEGVYQSTLRAKIRFPEIFEVSPAQSAERAAFEVEAAKSEATAFKLAESIAGELARKPFVSVEAPVLRQEVVVASSSKQVDSKETRMTPSLYPVYLPLWTQHRLLNDVQRILEEACYDFGRKHLRDAMDANEWTCVEAVELNLWSRFLRKHKLSIPHGQLEAVHRLPITASRVEHFLFDAECLCKLLKDDATFTTIAGLRHKTNVVVEDLKRNKDLLETKIGTTIKDFKKQREELERLEKAAIAQLLAENRDCLDMAGQSLGEVLRAVSSDRQDEVGGANNQNVRAGDDADSPHDEKVEGGEEESDAVKAVDHSGQVLQNGADLSICHGIASRTRSRSWLLLADTPYTPLIS